jgi:ATP-binding cassette subfamily F protein 3
VPSTPVPAPAPEAVQAAVHAKRLNPIKLKKLEDRVAAIEQELATIDSRIAATEESLGHYVSAEESQRTAASLDSLREQRSALTTEWESLASTLEEQSD